MYISLKLWQNARLIQISPLYTGDVYDKLDCSYMLLTYGRQFLIHSNIYITHSYITCAMEQSNSLDSSWVTINVRWRTNTLYKGD